MLILHAKPRARFILNRQASAIMFHLRYCSSKSVQKKRYTHQDVTSDNNVREKSRRGLILVQSCALITNIMTKRFIKTVLCILKPPCLYIERCIRCSYALCLSNLALSLMCDQGVCSQLCVHKFICSGMCICMFICLCVNDTETL